MHLLSKSEGLRVAARTSAFAFKGRSEDIRVIGKQLGVGSVLEGSVRKAGDRLRITAQLIQASDGFHLWSETYERRLEDVFAIQDEIALAINELLRQQLASSPETSRDEPPTQDFRAYELVLKGYYHFFQLGYESNQKAIASFEALEIDPNYAPAYAGLASSYTAQWDSHYERNPQVLSKAKAAASLALAIDSNLPEAHRAMAFISYEEGDWQTFPGDGHQTFCTCVAHPHTAGVDLRLRASAKTPDMMSEAAKLELGMG